MCELFNWYGIHFQEQLKCFEIRTLNCLFQNDVILSAAQLPIKICEFSFNKKEFNIKTW